MIGMTLTRTDLLPLTPRQQLRAGRTTRRLTQLTVGLVLYGVSMGMMVRSGLGLDPWDVLHDGLSSRLPLSFGQIVIATGVLVLLVWWPLRQWPGLGTLANVMEALVTRDCMIGVAKVAIPGRSAN